MKKQIMVPVLAILIAGCADAGSGNYRNYDGSLNERGMRRCTYWDKCEKKRDSERDQRRDRERDAGSVAQTKDDAKEQAASTKPAAAPAPVAAATAEKSPGTAEGTVKSKDGAPVEATVTIEKDGETIRKAATKDSAYSEQLGEGEYLVRATAGGHEPQAKRVTVSAGKKTVTDFVLVPSSKALARVEGNRIIILQTVYFATSKADILEKSNDLLNDVARVLVDNPQIRKVEVSGHTDSVGDAGANKRLSQARAESVKAFLVRKGVAAERLIPVGYGEENLVISLDDTKEKQAQNRRVEFLVLEPAQN